MNNLKKNLFIFFILCEISYFGSCRRIFSPRNDDSNYNDNNSQQQLAETDSWNGRWFPEQPQSVKSSHESQHHSLYDPKHKIKMGIPNDNCDNGMVNLTVDWDYSSADYTCFDHLPTYDPKFDVFPILECEHIPKGYWAAHACMNEKIIYDQKIPTFGTHRPLWPKYGEYRYVPPQRWLHSLEHGAIVMLYHPCANKQEIKLLKNLVKGCLYRHVITPYQALTPERPFALVSWGCRIEMSKIDPKIVVNFIRERALRGPEQTSRDGQYEQELLHHAQIVTTQDDPKLCPTFDEKL